MTGVYKENGVAMMGMNAFSAELPNSTFEKHPLVGECKTYGAIVGETEGLEFGLWECAPCEFTTYWAEWETFTILAGKGTLTDSAGKTYDLAPGLMLVMPAGSSAIWKITETIRKTYVYPVKS